MSEDIIKKARALLGDKKPTKIKGQLNGKTPALGRARELLDLANQRKNGLDVYMIFDTTGSMIDYLDATRKNIEEVAKQLLIEDQTIRLSINGVGDHCDGNRALQMWGLSNSLEEICGEIHNIQLTSGGDVPEAYECIASAMAKRIPTESGDRKKAVIFIADSIPHGIIDEPCPHTPDYETAFRNMKSGLDGFYFVGCSSGTYSLQRRLLVDETKDKEKFIPLGDMVDTLPYLLIALAKKTSSEEKLTKYLTLLEKKDSLQAEKVRGLLR